MTGDNQLGVIGEPLPEPFVAFVHDEGGNPVEGVQVTFEVAQGGGSFGGNITFVDTTNGEGRAAAVFTLGTFSGNSNNIATASIQVGDEQVSTAFIASAVAPGVVEDTKLSGVILDHVDEPIEGVTVSIVGTSLQAVTDSQGQFTITGAPVGSYHLRINGSTTTRPGTWPELEFEVNLISGVDNTLGSAVHLLPIDTGGGQVAGGSQDVTLTVPDLPGFSMTVFANSVTFPDGSRSGLISVTQVHADKVPMSPIEGAAPRLVWTLQPPGAYFDPPVRVTYPNIYGLKPGQVVDILSFDHDMFEFVSVGTGTVNEDGSVITSDPGFGITKAGWGYAVPPAPPTTIADNSSESKCKQADRKAQAVAYANQGTVRQTFSDIQACITREVCSMEDSFVLDSGERDPVAGSMLLQFISEWHDSTGIWPLVNLSCEAYLRHPITALNADDFCAMNMAFYHISWDLTRAMIQHGCGSERNWETAADIIKSCVDEVQDLPFSFAGKFIVEGARDIPREVCKRVRERKGLPIESN